jgi:peroxin-4
MASSSRSLTPTKRLLAELKDYQDGGNEALEALGPISDDLLTEWTAVMKGVKGTAYEGSCR